MSLVQVALNLRAISTPKSSISLTFTRFRSTTAINPSFLEARARVKEHTRNVSRSSPHNALVTLTEYVSLFTFVFVTLLTGAISAVVQLLRHPPNLMFPILLWCTPPTETLLQTILSSACQAAKFSTR